MIATETSISELVDDLQAMGVEGSHVMIHSSYKLMRPVEGGPAGVVDAFIHAVGSGVLLFPTFDFASWSELGYWDRRKSPSKMGAISEATRWMWERNSRGEKRPLFDRSPHPMLSFAVYNDPQSGREAIRRDNAVVAGLDYEWDYLANPVNGHGPGSVFAKLIENDGLLLSIGADKQEGFKADDVGFTASVHAFVEAGVEWRMMKIFKGVYVENGVSSVSIREYAASVNRWPEKYQTAVTPGHLEGERQGVIKRMKLGRTECWVASARDFHAFAMESCVKRPELWRKEIR